MPDAELLEAARRLATRALADLSRRGISSPTSPPCTDLPALRCCLQLVPLLNVCDRGLAARCCRGLLAYLGAILSRDPAPSLLPALEVFAGSLVFSVPLKSCLAMLDFAAPEESRVFPEALPMRGEDHLVLELVCEHFISSLPDEGGFEMFLRALSWSGNESLGTPEISFQGALALIHRTRLFSSPAAVQAHLFLLVSRCISGQNMDLHLLAFEYAMDLYVGYLPALRVFNRTGGMKTPLSCSVQERPFCIKAATDQKLRRQIKGLLLFCQLHSGDDLPTDESTIDRLIEENQHILHENFRHDCTVVLKRILSNIMCCATAKKNEVLESDTEVSDGVICLAAVLRLMSSSLLHILRCFSQMKSATDKENVDYTTIFKEYNVIYESICLIGQHEANELHRYDLLDIIGIPVDRERASVLMLAHFATLSVCSVRRRLGFLWKGCIVMMMMFVNLIAEEEGLDRFWLSTDVSKESAVFFSIEESTLKVSARTKAIASRFENIHKIHKGWHIDGDASSLGTPRECKAIAVAKPNGQAFLECLPGYSPAWHDLHDFFECEEGKDYANVLEQREKFRSFKVKKRRRKRQSDMESTINILGLKSRRLCA